MSILDKIVKTVRRSVEKQKREKSIEDMEINRDERRSLVKGIRSCSETSIIGELKRTSPTSGVMRKDFQPKHLAKSIAEGGAVGISVLTEPKYFDGKLEYLKEVSSSVEIPVLRKDFILDEYQLYQTAEMEADSVLLISEILGDDLPKFTRLARELNIEPLVEISKEEHIDLAERAESDLIGINNRDLNSMEIDLSRTGSILKNISNGFVVISESGIKERSDIEIISKAGADAALVGTAIMESRDVRRKIQDLRGVSNG